MMDQTVFWLVVRIGSNKARDRPPAISSSTEHSIMTRYWSAVSSTVHFWRPFTVLAAGNNTGVMTVCNTSGAVGAPVTQHNHQLPQFSSWFSVMQMGWACLTPYLHRGRLCSRMRACVLCQCWISVLILKNSYVLSAIGGRPDIVPFNFFFYSPPPPNPLTLAIKHGGSANLCCGSDTVPI
jgi:hypothetical protein